MRKFAEWSTWLYWGFLLTGVSTFLGYTLYESNADVYLIGELTQGHHQIELACSSCHSAPFGGDGVIQDACVECHGEELRQADDSHPKTKFTDPRNADRVALLDARACITCHVEHYPERVRSMGVTLPDDLCSTCHAKIADERPSHRGLDFATCASGGCHNFHDNRALYEDFLLAHQVEDDTRASARVPARDITALMAGVMNHPLAPLSRADADMPAGLKPDERHVADWAASAHARAGVNCMNCHAEDTQENGVAVWRDQPAWDMCERCHRQETAGFKSGKHGMRLQVGLSPMTPAQALIPMHDDAFGEQLGCQSCHQPHSYDVRKAAVDSCVSCHDDMHTNNYQASPHAVLWQKELTGAAPAGSGVSCSTCHLPRSMHTIDGIKTVLADHNQNANLRPNEKMLRSVCMNCHGLAFALDALADADLVKSNFNGRPERHVPSIDLAVKRHAEEDTDKPDHATHDAGE